MSITDPDQQPGTMLLLSFWVVDVMVRGVQRIIGLEVKKEKQKNRKGRSDGSVV